MIRNLIESNTEALIARVIERGTTLGMGNSHNEENLEKKYTWRFANISMIFFRT